ncbi:Hypothetical protein SMAX5B_004427 [Scophthalmus maximus]|uniref:Uncharacterized protein n=1 Tax=Scophthalmus maximus TaxID=52904 RepID=A0A2U9AZZ5_SCOMX|nr:Hypothetical protein SMAX5B_004427 [Scophthalmus maximus]
MARRFDWFTLSPSPGPGRFRARRTARLQKETTIKERIKKRNVGMATKSGVWSMAQVGDGMDHSQEAVSAGQALLRADIKRPSVSTATMWYVKISEWLIVVPERRCRHRW